jgi:4-diphosphocytidyl-2-C-methyl-D-erythritol kinase
MSGVRTDGYHLLRTVLQSIALADVLTLSPHDGPFVLTCDSAGVPADATNLAWQGAAAMAGALRRPLDGWRLHLGMAVPPEAGLGGGSADAVAAARLFARAHGARMSAAQLADVVRPLGADVAYFAYGGTVQGEGVGDVLSPLPDVPAAAAVIVRPPFGVSTPQAYRWYDEAQAAALAEEDRDARDRGLVGWGNDLEAPVASRHPEIRAIVDRLRWSGARLAAMSGSGSACFGLFPLDVDLERLETGWPPGTRVWRTRLLSRAEYEAATGCSHIPQSLSS